MQSELHTAQHEYAAAQRDASTASNYEIQSDLDSLQLMAACVRQVVDRSWKLYRATNDASRNKREFTTEEVARMIGDTLSESFGLSAEGAKVLDAAIKEAGQ